MDNYGPPDMLWLRLVRSEKVTKLGIFGVFTVNMSIFSKSQAVILLDTYR